MRIAVVTGASSGLGREFVKLLDADRDKWDQIWVIARRAERLQELAGTVKTTLRVLPMDLTEQASVEQLRTLFEEEQPQIGMLINAAGFGKIGRYDEISDEQTARMIDLNCRAPVMLCQICLTWMPEGARIMNICSTAGFSPLPYFNVYAASKSFLYRYSRALRVELLQRGISVTAVCPYWVKDTEFIPTAGEGEGGKGSRGRSRIRHFPLSSRQRLVARLAMQDTKRRLAVSTPGPVCTLHRFFGKILPDELFMSIWALIRRL